MLHVRVPICGSSAPRRPGLVKDEDGGIVVGLVAVLVDATASAQVGSITIRHSAFGRLLLAGLGEQACEDYDRIDHERGSLSMHVQPTLGDCRNVGSRDSVGVDVSELKADGKIVPETASSSIGPATKVPLERGTSCPTGYAIKIVVLSEVELRASLRKIPLITRVFARYRLDQIANDPLPADNSHSSEVRHLAYLKGDCHSYNFECCRRCCSETRGAASRTRGIRSPRLRGPPAEFAGGADRATVSLG